jgi:hypothetical protein
MKENRNPFHVIDIPSGRREMPNLLDLYWWKHSIYGLLEVDVTVARQFIADHKAETGEALSFTGYLVYCVARAVDEDKTVQAYLKGRKQLAVFEDVDVAMPVGAPDRRHTRPDGPHHPASQPGAFAEIPQEIRTVQSQSVPLTKGSLRDSLFHAATLFDSNCLAPSCGSRP